MHLSGIDRANMAADGCIFHRTLTRSRPAPNQASSSSPVVCRESLHVVDIRRYSRDPASAIYFPQAVLSGEDLYDVTLTDGDCRLQVTLDPGLNRLVERRVLKPGSALRNAAFIPALSAQLPECPGASADRDSYRMVSVQVDDEEEEEGVRRSEADWDSLPWFGPSEPAGALLPLRASRSVFLPLWNNVDYSGEEWTEAPPTDSLEEEEDEEEEEEGRQPSVTVSELRERFLSSHRGVSRGAIQHQLIVRIINKSHLMYYGRTDRNCECPYKAVLQACDRTGSVCVVLWNSVCVSWYRRLELGDIISLRRFRVKQHYQAEVDDIEISVNSRNPAAQLCVVSESSVSPESVPPAPSHSFYNRSVSVCVRLSWSKPPADPPVLSSNATSKEFQECRHGSLCDVIGLLTFAGRSERVRNKDGRGAGLLEYRWLRLEDGSSEQPIMVKLFSTSQPETQLKLHPLSVVVCTRLRPVTTHQNPAWLYLTNTTYTQVYCTGQGHHPRMSYRRLQPVRSFLQWLRGQEDQQVLSRALIGGFFIFPPPPVSLETLMRERRGEIGFLQGAELQRELERLCYRERRTFCLQSTVSMVTYSCTGEEDRCLFWTDRPSPSPRPPSFKAPPSSPFCPTSPSSSLSASTPRPAGAPRSGRRRKLLMPETPSKRRPLLAVQPEPNRTEILFEASMEFVVPAGEEDEDDDEDDDDDSSSYATALPPTFSPVATETLPLRFDYSHREEQAAAMAMGGGASAESFGSAPKDYYTVRLRALSDGLTIDAVFLPHLSSSSHRHANTWTSILSQGAFSSHTPPPSPADLIAMAPQLANQRLVCVLEACHLGGARTELVLSRGFHLKD
ncbi:RPA-related protein RADX isoform X3 [Xiphophorus couchianus]|uniref:RPA-related protein RADX isoform X3 n=1 Tax=Xiphophorus couchianus TaxID=32473 RepID=UPI00101651D0|nr:RPA-related protein RADX-like isoform X3 [Xiphophorus couchianus]